MNPEHIEALRVVVRSIALDAERSLVATFSEGHAKVVAVDALLRAGYSVIEGSNRPGQGRLLSYAGSSGIQSQLVELPTMAPREGSGRKRSSPDIRIAAPVTLTVELQTRSVHGSQSALGSTNILDDIQRLLDRRADAFVLAADKLIYDALLGDKQDRRGRNARAPTTMVLVLPHPAKADHGQEVHDALAGVLPFRQMIAVVPSPVGGQRVIAAIWTDSSVLDPELAHAQRHLADRFAQSGLRWNCVQSDLDPQVLS